MINLGTVIKTILMAAAVFWAIVAVFSASKRFFVPRKNALLRMGIFLLLIMGSSVFGLYLDNYLIYSGAGQILMVVFAASSFAGGRWGKLCAVAMFAATLEFFYQIVYACISISKLFILKEQAALFGFETDFLIGVLAFGAAGAGLSYVAGRMQRQGEVFTESCGKLVFFLVCFLLFLVDTMRFGISKGITLVPDFNGDPLAHEIMAHAVILVLSFLSISLYMFLFLGLHRLMQDTAVEEIKKTKIAYYETILEQYKTRIGLRHDMKKHLIGLSSLAQEQEWEKLEAYMKKLSEAVRMGEADIETGNIIANAVLNTKKLAAAKENVTFTCEAVFTDDIRLYEFELCIIMGTILDNAIKEAKKVGDAKKRFIRVSGCVIKRNLMIEVVNSIKRRTVKSDFGPSEYGNGLTTVKDIVKRMDGTIDITENDSEFSISFKFPMSYRNIQNKKIKGGVTHETT